MNLKRPYHPMASQAFIGFWDGLCVGIWFGALLNDASQRRPWWQLIIDAGVMALFIVIRVQRQRTIRRRWKATVTEVR